VTKIGIDLGKKASDVCVMGSATEVSERFRVATTREALTTAFANRPAAQIAVEACRGALWVREVLMGLGHEVVLVDTSRARAIGIGQGKRKNDRRDAEALARALWAGVVPRAHVLSHEAQRLRDVLHARHQLVGMRTELVTQLRGQMQARGVLVPGCRAEEFARRLRESGGELVGAVQVQSALRVIEALTSELTVLTAELQALAARHEPFERLCTVPGVKLIVALSFMAALDRAARFRTAHQVEAYLGLVPSERSTGGQQRLGRITKAGDSLTRSMLVQASHTLLRVRGHDTDPLVVWGRQLAARRGKRVAVTAVARRLAGVLWAMWMDGTDYDPKGLARASAGGLSRRARETQREAATMQQIAA